MSRRFLLLAASLLGACGGTTRPTAAPCGTDTTDVAGVCQSVLSCGEGTTREGDACVSSGGGGSLCGTDTRLDGDSCVGVVTCGSGTTRDGNSCKPSGSTLTCGSGTTQNGTQCVPSGTTLTCGSGTTQSGNQCVASGTTVTCGSGTTLSGSQCVASGSSLTCGAGTVQSGNQCLPGSSAPTTIATFMSTPKQSYFVDRGPSRYEYELIHTDMDDAQARAFIRVDATPIGGPFAALVIQAGSLVGAAPRRPSVATLAIRAPETCSLEGIRTASATFTDAHVGFVRDFAGTPTAVCANGGSMTVGFNSQNLLEVQFTTQFSDGTVLTGATVAATSP